VIRHDAGSLVRPEVATTTVGELGLTARWQASLAALVPSGQMRPVQVVALRDSRILDSRRNLVVSAPTNSGKSLVGTVVLLDAVSRGQRAILVEPLRALAQEKGDELSETVGRLPAGFYSNPPKVRVSTGDYRLLDEHFDSAPPAEGEILVVTPERLDSILRLDAEGTWLRGVGAVVVDEAHLVGTPRRGPTLEIVVATLKTAPSPPRIVFLSATFGEPQNLVEWLTPCDLVRSMDPVTDLTREVLELTEAEKADEVVQTIVEETLKERGTSVLVFVYQRASAEKLARETGAAAYHSGMSAAQKARVKADLLEGRTRCVVTTTALGMGVNLPATHVILRDTTFHGYGRLETAAVLQMLGRAGRGDRSGTAIVLVRPADEWTASELAAELRSGRVGTIRSALESATLAANQPSRRGENGKSTEDPQEVVATSVASLLCRRKETGAAEGEIRDLFAATLAGPALARRVPEGLRWLEDSRRLLGYRGEDGRHILTTLGRRTAKSMAPLTFGAGVGQLIRDLLEIDPKDRHLAAWRPMDSLLLVELLSGRSPSVRRFSDELVDQVDAWMESTPGNTTPLLYREWIRGTSEASKAEEVLGSLTVGTCSSASPMAAKRDAWKAAYLATMRAALLWDRSLGRSTDDLSRRWKAPSLEGIEEGWRDTNLWLLRSLANLLDVRCFYFHLVETCGSSPERVQRVKKLLQSMQRDVFDLQEQLKYCSALGPVLRGVRNLFQNAEGPTVGIQTIRKIEEAGVTDFPSLAKLSTSDLVELGVRKDFAKQLTTYVRRRLA
jgi:superfamily II DNA/RNA helicase